jgi:hypothetical protein
MKTICLFVACCVACFSVRSQTNSVHIWHLIDDSKVEGEYISSGLTTLVISHTGTNFLIPLSKLSAEDKVFIGGRIRFPIEFKLTYDKFRNVYDFESVKHIKADLPSQYTNLQMKFGLLAVSDTVTGVPPFVNIEMEAHFPVSALYPNAQVLILYDGKRMDLGKIDVDDNYLGETDSGSDHFEQMSIRLKFGDFKEMANAKSLEMQIGVINDVIFDYNSRFFWRDLADHFQ